VARRSSDEHHSDGRKPQEKIRIGWKVTVREDVITVRSERCCPVLLGYAGGELGAHTGHRSVSVGVYSRAPEVPYVKKDEVAR
jgi:hypothetical protein